MAQKPTIVIVPGAWHNSSHFTPLTSRLESAGYIVHALDLPAAGINGGDPQDTGDHTSSVQHVASTIRSAADDGQDVVVVVHSAGGIIGSEGTIGLSKADRSASGKPGGVIRMVYLCAFAAPEGLSLYDATNGPMDWQAVTGETTYPKDPEYRFYHDCDPEVAKKAVASIGKHSLAAKWSKPTYAAWKHIPSTYLVCEEDRAIEKEAQESMCSSPEGMWTVVRCGSAHSPFLSMPDFTAEVVRKAAGEDL